MEEDDLPPDAASVASVGSVGSVGSVEAEAAPVAQFAPPLPVVPAPPSERGSVASTAQSRKSPHSQTFAQRRPVLFRHFVPLAAAANLSAYETSLIYKGLKLASSLEREPEGEGGPEMVARLFMRARPEPEPEPKPPGLPGTGRRHRPRRAPPTGARLCRGDGDLDLDDDDVPDDEDDGEWEPPALFFPAVADIGCARGLPRAVEGH